MVGRFKAALGAAVTLALLAGAAEAREPERRTFRDERGRITGRTVEERGAVRFYDAQGRPAGQLRRSGEGWRAYDARGRAKGSIREEAPVRRQGFDGDVLTPWTRGRA